MCNNCTYILLCERKRVFFVKNVIFLAKSTKYAHVETHPTQHAVSKTLFIFRDKELALVRNNYFHHSL